MLLTAAEAAARWLLLILLLASGILLGWRASITFEPRPIHYIPIPVRDTIANSHWYLRDWPYRWER